eukprot:TRINITY_DN95344_c0_g1_i1.p2 TRINITY_DN95344_c0_g1~~TRINITY_DN95344_c0_g1_i1.p2  ORF type:complete len:103 (+),score=24.56 TRINITY_DN95344_c0_g1_i1:71-379(+)
MLAQSKLKQSAAPAPYPQTKRKGRARGSQTDVETPEAILEEVITVPHQVQYGEDIGATALDPDNLCRKDNRRMFLRPFREYADANLVQTQLEKALHELAMSK